MEDIGVRDITLSEKRIWIFHSKIYFLQFDFYRFSISWTRILPTGYDDVVSRQGLQYYHDLLDELEYRGIIPFVTIYHWDHPQKFENEFGGWLDEQMAFLFSKYARVVFREFWTSCENFFYRERTIRFLQFSLQEVELSSE